MDEFAGENLAIRQFFCSLPHAPHVLGQLLLDGTMGRIGRMGRMIMGQGDKGTVLWRTMGLWDEGTLVAAMTAQLHKFGFNYGEFSIIMKSSRPTHL